MTATSQLTRPIYFDAAGEQLFGVFTRPEGEPNGIAVLVLFGAGNFPTSGRNQARARLARELADLGYHVLRIDYRGVGDSGGEARKVNDVSSPWVDDPMGALRWLQAEGFDRILVVGVCFGAVGSLAVFSEIPHLVGMALVALPMVDATHREVRTAERDWSWYMKRAASPKALRLLFFGGSVAGRRRGMLKEDARRAITRGMRKSQRVTERGPNAELLDRLTKLIGSGVPVRLMYGRGDSFYDTFERARTERLGEIIASGGASVRVQIEDGALVRMGSVELQDVFVASIVDFAREVSDAERGVG